MPIFFYVNYTGVADLAGKAGVSKAGQAKATRYAMYHVAAFWHRNILPMHFTAGARRRYHHKQRKRRYSEIKRNFAAGIPYRDPRTGVLESVAVMKGGDVDVVFRGNTEDRARMGRVIRATQSGFTLTFIVPRYITMRRRGDFPNMKRELSMVTRDESRLLTRVFWRNYKLFINSNRVTHTFRTI